jgi:hypothetical protein
MVPFCEAQRRKSRVQISHDFSPRNRGAFASRYFPCSCGGPAANSQQAAPSSANAEQKVTFNRDIAPIIFHNCASCHHAGEAGPFPLLTYENVRKHARQIAEVTRDRYWNFILPVPIDQTRWLKAIEIRLGDKHLIHHANILVDRTRSVRRREKEPGAGFSGMDLGIESEFFDPDSHFLFWKPGTVPYMEPDGMALRLDKGTDLILNMHLQPSGKPELIKPAWAFTSPTSRPPCIRFLSSLKVMGSSSHALYAETTQVLTNARRAACMTSTTLRHAGFTDAKARTGTSAGRDRRGRPGEPVHSGATLAELRRSYLTQGNGDVQGRDASAGRFRPTLGGFGQSAPDRARAVIVSLSDPRAWPFGHYSVGS